MLERFKHVNSAGDVLDFLGLGIYANANELRDYEWNVLSDNDIITGFTRGVTTKVIPFVFYCDSSKAIEIKNKFYEHFEIDVLNNLPGYFDINGYHYYCYLTKSSKNDYLISKRMLKIEVEVTSDKASWIKEDVHSFGVSRGSSGSKTYQYKYSYVYGKAPGNEEITNDSLKASDFKIVIYGPVTSPSIAIGGHIYSVDVDVSNAEYLVIDSLMRKVYVNTISGNELNVFNKRNFDSYIFEKIPPGFNLVTWTGEFGFDLTIYDERSEPKWT